MFKSKDLEDAQRVQVMKSLGLVIEESEEQPAEVGVIPELPEFSSEIDYYKEYFRMYL